MIMILMMFMVVGADMDTYITHMKATKPPDMNIMFQCALNKLGIH
jgi:uncharacterized short protein YbdD (DUF466 family)